jgi:hypothetical protein
MLLIIGTWIAAFIQLRSSVIPIETINMTMKHPLKKPKNLAKFLTPLILR